MDAEVERLARKVLNDVEKRGPNGRVIIGIAGVPGAGKTTLAAAVANKINQLAAAAVSPNGGEQGVEKEEAPLAVCVPMDGFHLTRAQLAAMPDAAEAVRRRGAAFTFDGAGFLSLIRSLASSSSAVLAPAFRHEIKDPEPDAIAVSPRSRVVLVEGNYCALDRPPWRDAAALMAELWYVETETATAQARLARRHVASGVAADEEAAWERARGSDEMNAREIREALLPVDEVIRIPV